MKPFVQRYLAAALIFVVAAVWVGLALEKALECLLAFLCALFLATAAQRRQGEGRRRNRSRSRGGGLPDPRTRHAVQRRRAHRSNEDGGAGWPLPADKRW